MSDDDEAFAGRCPTCGQHYLEARVAELEISEAEALAFAAKLDAAMTRRSTALDLFTLNAITAEQLEAVFAAPLSATDDA
jgi:hypothetical protein